MRTIHRVVLLTALAAFIVCVDGLLPNFDPDKLDFLVSMKRRNFLANARTCFPAVFPAFHKGFRQNT